MQDKEEHEIELDKYLKASAENEAQQIKEYIMSRVAFVIDDPTDDLPNKIRKQGLAKESKRKMRVYSTECFGHFQHCMDVMCLHACHDVILRLSVQKLMCWAWLTHAL